MVITPISPPACPLFEGLESKQSVLLTHGDTIQEVPEDLQVVGTSGGLVAALQHKTKPIFGVQFHPEVDLTLQGRDMLRNFLFKVSGQGNHLLLWLLRSSEFKLAACVCIIFVDACTCVGVIVRVRAGEWMHWELHYAEQGTVVHSVHT